MRELSRREKTEFNKLQKRLRRNVGNAIAAVAAETVEAAKAGVDAIELQLDV